MDVFICPTSPIIHPLKEATASSTSSTSPLIPTTEPSSEPLITATPTVPLVLTTDPVTKSTSRNLAKPPSAPSTTDRASHSNEIKTPNDDSIPFKVWRLQQMMTIQADDYDNMPIDPPRPSTLLEKHLQRNRRELQLQHYRTWYNKQVRKRRQQPQEERCRRVQFTLPRKRKRSRSLT